MTVERRLSRVQTTFLDLRTEMVVGVEIGRSSLGKGMFDVDAQLQYPCQAGRNRVCPFRN
ncbi:hypothetical protein PG996_013670 [Apiospora saccharicola]|uniref:Uncharacterized protein n=1 Tax=Apiospora saccharicola TaxID=335842 RepID=A0ABR1U647_9PEZI